MYNAEIPPREELPSTKTLLRSTFVAALVAAALLITTILPAEYGIDPTGIGRLTGLTEMGEIKTQLEKEAEADRLGTPAPTPAPAPAPERRSDLFGRLFAGILVSPAAAHDGGHGPAERGLDMYKPLPAAPELVAQAGRTDEMTVTLDPGQGAEIKLTMPKGAKVNYSWSTEGGKVNYDKHGDGPGGSEKSYEKGRGVEAAEGVLEAGHSGKHGWFWRNRTKSKVTVKLRTSGEYTDIKRTM